MSKLRPVNPTYTPKYPRRLTEAELRDYLRPGLARRFSNETMVLSTLLVGSTLASCARMEPQALERRHPLPMMGKSPRTDQALKAQVDQVVAEVLGMPNAEAAMGDKPVWHYRLIADNPMVRVPAIQIVFGNSLSGIFDVDKARDATKKLFATYGIGLEEGIDVTGEGYGFAADGFNHELAVGFEIRVGDGKQEFFWDAALAEENSGEHFLGARELVALEKDIELDKLDVFVCNSYDNFGVWSMYQYLASVVDYLNWIHGDREIDYRQTRLIRWAPGHLETIEELWEPSLGESAEVQRWKITGGKGNVSIAANSSGILVELDPGATVNYDLRKPVPYGWYERPAWTGFVLSVNKLLPVNTPIDIDFCVNGDDQNVIRKTYMPGDTHPVEFARYDLESIDATTFHSLSIANVNRFPITISPAKLEKRLLPRPNRARVLGTRSTP